MSDEGKLAQAIELLTAQGIKPQEYKHLTPDRIIQLAGVKSEYEQSS